MRRYRVKRGKLVVMVVLVFWLVPYGVLGSEMEAKGGVRLQGVDKVTARVAPLTVAVGETSQFGTLRIHVRACYQSLPIEEPESAAFLEIIEVRPPPEEEILRFSGWMFASSPSLSFLEHAVYDIWVVTCLEFDHVDQSGSSVVE